MRVRRFPVQLGPLALLCVVPWILLPLPLADALSVYLRRTAWTGQEVVLLGDVAAVTAADPETADRLRRLPLWQASGKPVLVPADVIRQRLADAFDGQVVVVGGHTAVLPRASTGRLEAEFYTKLLEAVAALPGIMAGRIEVELLSRLELPLSGDGQAGDDGPAVAVVSLVPAGSRAGRAAPGGYVGGTFQATYRLTSPESPRPAATAVERGVGVRIRQILPVAYAAVDIPAGRVLRREDLELREEDIGSLAGGFLRSSDQPGAYRAVASLARGQRIDPARLERHYLVRAGDTVTVVFLRPGLRVSLPGRAFSSGAAGDRVEVRPRDASRRFTGKVAPSGEVIVEEL